MTSAYLAEDAAAARLALDLAERMGWVEDAEEFIGVRKLRNLLVHEYMTESALFLEAIVKAKAASEMLFGVVATVEREAMARGCLVAAK